MQTKILAAACTLFFAAASYPNKMNDSHSEISAPEKQNNARLLTAGPIRVKFQDGELRYLYVGDKEIVRRVYFAVRDGSWATALPKFTQINVHEEKGGFQIDLAATCKTDTADFSWTGTITGSSDGKIIFTATGAANQDFDSNRIGLCVLFGTPSVTGQKFETVRADTTVTQYSFPALVSHELVSPNFQTLRYTTPDNLSVSVHADGARIDMEDQRSYGDSSFKAYAPLPYSYKHISRGDRQTETVMISVQGTPQATAAVKHEIVVRVGRLLPGITVPRVGVADPTVKDAVFGSVNGKANQWEKAAALSWGYRPNVHLKDDDTAIENLPTILDQVKTAHSYAPDAKITLEPVSPGTVSSPALGAAWIAASVKYLALAGVSAAKFAVDEKNDSPAQKMQKHLATLSGRSLYEVTLTPSGASPAPVEAFAVDENNKPTLYLVNLSGTAQKVTWINSQPNTTVQAGVAGGDESTKPQNIKSDNEGKMTLEIPPYTTCIVRGS